MPTRTPTPEELQGVWLLESVEIPLAGGAVERPFGDHPDGTIIYLSPRGGRGGTMAVHIRGSGAAAARLRAYAGRWRMSGGSVVHDVEASVEPDLRGVRLERRADYDPAARTLTYRTAEVQGAGLPVVLWRRA